MKKYRLVLGICLAVIICIGFGVWATKSNDKSKNDSISESNNTIVEREGTIIEKMDGKGNVDDIGNRVENDKNVDSSDDDLMDDREPEDSPDDIIEDPEMEKK